MKKITRQIMCLITTIALLLSFMPANFTFAEAGFPQGNTYYVATNGNDANDGSEASPFATISHACSILQPGDTLLIKGGEYNEAVTVVGKGNDTSNVITIKNYDDEKVFINTKESPDKYNFEFVNCYNIDISGLSFTYEGDMWGWQGLIFHSSHKVKAHNCEFYGVGCGAMARAETTDFEIYSNTMYGCTQDYGGVLIYKSSNGKVYNNVFHDNIYGVNFYGPSENNQIYNNTFYNNSYDIGAIDIYGYPSGNIFRNNIFSSPITYDDSNANNFISKNDFDYNCYNANTMSDIVGGEAVTLEQVKALGDEQNGFTVYPKFLNAQTMELQIGRGSDCRAKGTLDYVPATDILGQARTGSVDLGAYVYADRSNYYVAATGNDSNAGTDEASFKTVAHALTVMQPGDYLYLKGGTYAEVIVINGKSNLTIMNYQDDHPQIILPSGASDKYSIMVLGNSSNINVSGFNLLNSSVYIASSSNIKVSYMDITGGLIQVNPGTDGYEIYSNKIHDYQGEGAILVYNGMNGNIYNNVIYDNAFQGILLEGSNCTNNNFYNNTLHGNGKDLTIVYAASLGDPSGNTFKNNIFGNQLEFGKDIYFTTNIFDYNFYDKANMSEIAAVANVYDSEGNYVSTINQTLDDFKAKGVETNGFLGDPAFMNVSNNDFRLRKESECIGKGTSSGAPLFDIEGIRRSSPYDAGAYKFTGAVSDYYVAVDGDDNNPGTVEAPFRTIQHAVDKMESGETIYIKGGRYDEEIVIGDKKGSAKDNYTIKNVSGEKVILDSQNQKSVAIAVYGSSYLNVEGLDINNYTAGGIEIKGSSGNISIKNVSISSIGGNGISIDNTANGVLDNVRVSNTSNAVVLSNSSGWSVNKSSFTGAAEAAACFKGSSNITVKSSLFTNSGAGMYVAGSSNLIIYNNDFYGNKQSDMKLDQTSAGSLIKNNIFGSSSAAYNLEISDEGSINNELDYNCYNRGEDSAAIKNNASECTFAQFKELGQEPNGILADPMFTDAANGNFLLKAHSPCADRGISDSNSPIEGYDGALFETPMDIGAIFSPFSLEEYYVDGTNGSDGNDGSLEHPWKTLSKGMNSIKQSDTLYIRGGVYNERVDVSGKNGRPYAYFTVKNYNGEEVIMNTNFKEDVGIKFSGCSYWKVDGLKLTGYTGAGIWTASGSEYITMENLEIWNIDNPNFVASGTEGILGDGGNYCTVRKCYIHDIGMTRNSNLDHGIYIGYGSHHWTFDSNTIVNAAASGIQFYGEPTGGDNCIVTNNLIKNCRYGLILTMGKNNLVSNNTFYNNWYCDLYMDIWYNDSVIQNNIMYNDLPLGTKVMIEDPKNKTKVEYAIDPVPMAFFNDKVSNNAIRNNIVINKNFGNKVIDGLDESGEHWKHVDVNTYLGYQKSNTIEKLMIADPSFIDSAKGNFGLQANSPCIDAGIADLAPPVDIIGTTRVNGPDIGAYEFIPDNSSNNNGNNNNNNNSNNNSGNNNNQGNVIKVTPKLSKDGIASTDVSGDAVNKALNQAAADKNGIMSVKIEVAPADGAKVYSLGIPAAILMAGDRNHVIEVATPVAAITVPTNMIVKDAAKESSNLSLNVGYSSNSDIKGKLKDQIGNRPVIEINATIDGKKVAWNNPNAPVTISIAYKPTAGELKDPEHIVVWYIDGKGSAVPVPNGKYDSAAGKVTFKTTHFGKYAVASVYNTYDDIEKYEWAKKAIEVLASKGITDGMADTKFAPDNKITRAEFITLLVRAFGLTAKTDSKFDDVKPADYYYEAVGIAKQLGITKGTGKNKFNPNAAISRQDMMVLAKKAMEAAGMGKLEGDTSVLKKYDDFSKISPYAAESMAALIKEGIIQGEGKNVNPLQNATRAQAAVMVYQIYGRV